MKSSLYYDENDSKWLLLNEVNKVFDFRKTRQEFAKNGIKSINRGCDIFKIAMTALFFNLTISYVVSELNRNKKLQKQLNIDTIYTADQIYEFFSRFSDRQILEFIIKVLNSLNCKNTRGTRHIIVDGTDIQIDLNWLGRKISKKRLEKKPYKWGFSSSKGFYIGYKLSLAIDCRTMQPVAMLLHEGTPNDAKIFDEVMNELKIRRIIRKGDNLFFDKGYFSKENYQLAITKYETVALIFPRGKDPVKSVSDHLSYPLEIFKDGSKDKEFYKALAKEVLDKLKNWEKYKGLRSKIEDFNKLLKVGLSLTKIHRYTKESIHKFVWLNVFLGGLITSKGFRTKKEIQRLTEM
jgi:hypothetical protein